MAQQTVLPADTIVGADSATVVGNAFMQRLQSLNAVAITSRPIDQVNRGDGTSLVGAFQAVAGVRMEERSPGSYRLNIRGSSLRSPFGVRNVKIYWNGFPLTDAGGNTYLNQLGANAPAAIQVVKGPAGSMYGAGTGGVVLMEAMPYALQTGISAGYTTGSFGLQNMYAEATLAQAHTRHRFTYIHNQSSGYRDQAALSRDNLAYTAKLSLNERHNMTFGLLYTGLYYQTPGALTFQEFMSNPAASRPATGMQPSAADAKAAIHQKNLHAGISNRWLLNSHWTNHTAIFSSMAWVANPAIRNYEKRIEPNIGVSNVLSWKKQHQADLIQVHAGLEYQYGFYNTKVFTNAGGEQGALQTDDDLRFSSGFTFIQATINHGERWQLAGGASINHNRMKIKRYSEQPVIPKVREFGLEFAPRIEWKYYWLSQWQTQISFSKGFSPPTVSEVLPSTGNIDLQLQAEHGENIELANSFFLAKNKLRWDLNVFWFALKNALVQQRDPSGADFFINAGSTKQVGAESSLVYISMLRENKLADKFSLQLAYTYNHFEYKEYEKLGIVYDGNTLPGVPGHVVSFSGDISGKQGWYLQLNYLYNSKMMLNDANSFSGEQFHLVGAKAGLRKAVGKGILLHGYFGGDNLLNEVYSLGYDINAFGNRFYNAAPARNFYIGLQIGWHKLP